jgi:hypothetical protein
MYDCLYMRFGACGASVGQNAWLRGHVGVQQAWWGLKHVGGGWNTGVESKTPSVSCFQQWRGVMEALAPAGVCLIRKDLK